MLIAIAVLLVILWLLGMITSYTLGGFIHILLIVAVIVVLVRVIQGSNPLQAANVSVFVVAQVGRLR